MKKVSLLVAFCLGMSVAMNAQLFQQQFSTAQAVVGPTASFPSGNYVNAAPSTSQFNAVSAGATATVAVPDLAADAISPFQFKTTTTSTSSVWAVTRNTNFAVTPTAVIVKFDIRGLVGSSGSATKFLFYLGSGFSTAVATEAAANVHSGFGIRYTSSSFTFTNIAGTSTSATFPHNGIYHLTFATNNTGASQTYIAPDGTTESVANDTWDLWVGDFKIFNDLAATTAAQNINNIKFGDVVSSSGGRSDNNIDNLLLTDFTGNVIPAAPVATTAGTATPSSIIANWNAVSGATNYRLDVSTVSDFSSGSYTTLAAWNFPGATTDDPIVDVASANNTTKQINGFGVVSPTWSTTATGGTTRCAIATNWDNATTISKAWILEVSTVGYYKTRVSSKQTSSGTGPKNFKVQYRLGTNGGWTDVPSASVAIAGTASTFDASGTLTNVAMPAACDNQKSVFLRWIATTNTSQSGATTASGGTSRIDDILIEGDAGSFVTGWNDVATGNVLTTTVNTGLSASTTYYYRVRANNATDTSASSNIISTATTAPPCTNVALSSATFSASPICTASTTTLTYSGLSGTNASVTWYDGTTGTSGPHGTGTPSSAVGPGTYHARATGDCGSPVEITVVVGAKVNVALTSASATASPICSASTTTLTYTGLTGDGATVTWYDGTTGTTGPHGTGTPSSAVGPGTYHARATGDCGSPVEITVVVGAKVNVALTSASATASPICSASTTTLTYSGLSGDGASVTWYDGTGATGGTHGTGTPSSPVGPGTYYAYATGDCGSPVEISVTVGSLTSTSITVDAAPSIQTLFINDPSPTAISITAAGASLSYQWYYNTSNSNNPIGATTVGTNSNSYTPPTNVLGTKYYFCVVTGTCGTATSSTATVTITNSNTWTAGAATTNWSTGANWSLGTPPNSTNDAVIPFGNTPYPVLSTSSAINDLIIDNGATVGIGAGNTFTITGAVTGTGTISGSATSNLVTTGNTGILFTSGANTLKNLAVNSGTLTLGNALNITGGTAINTYGTVTVASGATLASAGNLTIKSNEFGTARVAAGAAAGNYITGDVTVERYIPANAKRAWRLLSVPTKGTKTIKQTWQENQAPNANLLPGFGTIITGFQPTLAQVQAAGFDAYTQTASIQLYNGSTYAWDYLSSTNSSPIETNRGYFVYIRGDRSQTVDVATTSVTATTLRTTGTLYQGDGSAALTIPASKYMAVGNTFASAIDFTALSKTGTLSNTFYVWDAKLLSGTSLGAYQTFSLATGYTPATPGGSYPSGTPNTTIESGEAIMMTAPAGGGGTVKLVEASKTTGNQVNPFRPAARPAQFRTSLYKSGTVLADNNIVVFDNAYANGVDADDALKLAHGGENIDIVNSNQSLIVDARKPVESTDVINYSLKNLSAQQYKLEFSTINMNTAGLTAFVEDKYLHTTTAINLDATSEYTFVVDGSNAASKAADRISVVFKKAGVLPVSNVKAITVSPNPVQAGVVNLHFKNQPAGKYAIRILSNEGQVILSKTTSHAGGNNSQLLNLPKGIAAGTYQLEIIAADKTRTIQALFVNSAE